MPCLSIADLERLATGAFVGAGGAEVHAHVSSCPDCRHRLDEISENVAFIAQLRSGLLSRRGDGGPAAAETPLPDRIGAYEITREIGRGGMGVVYAARQRDPDRMVAVKVLHGGRARDPASTRLFRREAQALARSSHPFIAGVYEAGCTADGQPYFAMEFVDGLPLLAFAERHGLSLRERLELARKICDAIAFAHRRGVIHRDLTPSNILVTAEGTPKVLDFGLARILLDDDCAPPACIVTEAGRVFGTLPYMSPEQARGDPASVDVRSDVYALGVMLYELLTGSLPYELDARNLTASVRTICERAPTRPSSIRPQLRGDLDAILLKAVEKTPERRYRSATALGDDLGHCLHNEPVSAQPPSAFYQLRTFARRHRPAFAAAIAVAVVLVAGTAVSVWQAVRTTRAEVAARREVEKFKAVNSFLQDMLAAANPEQASDRRDATVRELFNDASAQLDAGSLTDQPEVEAAVRITLGDAYRALGDYEAAEPHLLRAVEIDRRRRDGGAEDLGFALNKLGRLRYEQGEYEQAEVLQREALALRRVLFGDRRLEVATSLNNLAATLASRGRFEEAEALHREALAVRRELLGPAHEEIANSLNNLAIVMCNRRQFAAAEPLLRESLAMDRRLRDQTHPNILTTMNNLATVLTELHEPEQAEMMLREVLTLRRSRLGEEHPLVAQAMGNLALALRRQEKLEEAERLYRDALAMNKRQLGETHPQVAVTMANLARLLSATGRPGEAEPLYLEAHAIRLAALGERHPATIFATLLLGDHCRETGRLDDAERWYRAAADAAAGLEADHPLALRAAESLAALDASRAASTP